MLRTGHTSGNLRDLFAPIVTACCVRSDYLSCVRPSCAFLPTTLLAFAWSLTNLVGSEVTGAFVFVVTGAMSRLANMVVDRLSCTAGHTQISCKGTLMSISDGGGFVWGAAWSAVSTARAPRLLKRGGFCLLDGIYGAIFLWLDREALGAWWSERDGKLCTIGVDEVDCS